jgi:phosphoribosylamine--glycine ligase
MVSVAGEGAHLLKMIQNESNDVRLFIKEPAYKSVFDGILPKAKKIDPRDDEVVIFDFSGFGKIADDMAKRGIPVVGGSSLADKMEQDREFGLELMKEAGIKVPFSQEFKGKAKGVEEFLKANELDANGEERRWVFKPSGKNLPSALTYCSCDREDLLQYMAYVDKNFGKDVESFVLQEFIRGVAISTEGWFNGERFVRPFNHTIEVKAFMDGCKGPATGCAGNIIWAEQENCRVVTSGLAKVEKLLAKRGAHVGPIDLNAIVNDEGVWGLEWTPRFGYDSMPTTLFLFKQDLGEFFSSFARKQLGPEMKLSDDIAAGVRFSIPPYPLELDEPADVQKFRPNEGVPVRGLTEKNAGKFYFYEVKSQDGQLVHAAGPGLLGVAIGVADSCHRAFCDAYCALDDLKVPELQYRTDLASVIGRMHDEADWQDGASTSLGMIPEVELENG